MRLQIIAQYIIMFHLWVKYAILLINKFLKDED